MLQTNYTEVGEKQLKVDREFNAPLPQVWNAWTDRKILDQWWAPLPYKAVTQKMDFREGGQWFYFIAK